ncbi:MAG: DUF2851 family protein [Bacteroidales bacterium]|nr:DUF2851 family protein [Bacteroidales bacterium]
MKEEFLHYLWRYGLFDHDKLLDNEGSIIEVVSPGEYNRDSGPDFFNSRLRIGGIEWAGNIEIHLKASDFNSHRHNADPAYDNIILHVVAVIDARVFNTRQEEIPTVLLPVSEEYYEKYLSLVNNPYTIACQSNLKDIDQLFLRHWLGSLAMERMGEKTGQVLKIYSETGNDWEETFYRLLSRYFGFRVNTGPFEMLASALPFRIIRKHSDNIFQIEALLFGTAGLLDEGLFREAVRDPYYLDLLKEYKILSAKYSLNKVHGWLWKFSRLRPANFPTVRISQLAAMLSVSGGIFSKALEAREMTGLRMLFGVTASGYWDDHFVFGKKCRPYPKTAGKQASDLLLINAVIPAIFAFGKVRDSAEICERAISFLEETAPEDNIITSEWEKIGISADSAFISQGLLQLRNSYCRRRRCLECRIGSRLISVGAPFRREEELILEPVKKEWGKR